MDILETRVGVVIYASCCFLWVLRFDFMLHHSMISKSPLKYLLIVMYGANFSGHFPGFFKVHFIQLPF